MALTMETLREAQRRLKEQLPPGYMGQGQYLDAPFLGQRVMIDDRVPPLEHPFWMIRPAHPWIRWLARFTLISPWVWYPTTAKEPVAYCFEGTLFMPAAMAHGILSIDHA